MSFKQQSPIPTVEGGTAGAFNVDNNNTFVGYDTGTNIINGDYNTCLGNQAGNGLASGNYCTFVGRQAGQSGNADFNTCVGFIAGQGAFGAQNTALGAEALTGFGVSFNGTYNLAIGRLAGSQYQTTESNNALFAHTGVTGESNVLRLGTDGSGAGQQDTAYIAGVYGVTTTSATTSPVLISDGFQLGTIASSIRYKTDVADMGDSSSAMMKLRPVTFKYKAHKDDVMQFGLIAEEVNEIMPGIVNLDEEGRPDSVRYHEMYAMLLNELQKLTARVAELEAKV